MYNALHKSYFYYYLYQSYTIKCKICSKIFVSITITAFRKLFNNRKSTINRYTGNQRCMSGERLYAHFFKSDHIGMKDISAMEIDRTDVKDPKRREAF